MFKLNLPETSEDRKAREQFDGLRSEFRELTHAEQRDECFQEFIDNIDRRGSADPHEMQLIVEKTLLLEPEQHRFLLELWGGDETRAAECVVEHMIDAVRNGHDLTMTHAISDCNSLAAHIINSPAKLWVPSPLGPESV